MDGKKAPAAKKSATPDRTKTEPKSRRKHRFWVFVAIFLSLLLVVRILLPYIVLRYVNKSLAEMDEYYGHVDDIDIALIRGAYVINDMRIVKLEENKKNNRSDTIPFFSAPKIDLSVEWRALFKGKVVGEVYVDDPILNFVNKPSPDQNLRGDTADFRQLARDLMPLDVNRFEIHRGEVHYIDPMSSPKVDLAMKNMEVTAENISNVNDSNKVLPAKMVANGSGMGGTFHMNMNFDGLNEVPTFDMNAEVKSLNLVQMNDFLRAYGNFDVKKGNLSAYAEFAAKKGQFGGYVKPILTDLDIIQWNKEEGSFTQKLWETTVAVAAEVLQNQRTGQLATKIPISGRFDDPGTDIWEAIVNVLRNAFVHALRPSIENTININHLTEEDRGSFIQRIFGGGKKKDGTTASKKEPTRKEKRAERRKAREERKSKK